MVLESLLVVPLLLLTASPLFAVYGTLGGHQRLYAPTLWLPGTGDRVASWRYFLDMASATFGLLLHALQRMIPSSLTKTSGVLHH